MGYLFHKYTCVEKKREEKYPSRCFLSPPIIFHLPLFPRSPYPVVAAQAYGKKNLQP
jgi:hypothetical protein